jgi:hypothetical protein
VSDHGRAEKFGQLMLSDDEEEKAFEDIDLDRLSDDEDYSNYEEERSSRKFSHLNDLISNIAGSNE